MSGKWGFISDAVIYCHCNYKQRICFSKYASAPHVFKTNSGFGKEKKLLTSHKHMVFITSDAAINVNPATSDFKIIPGEHAR